MKASLYKNIFIVPGCLGVTCWAGDNWEVSGSVPIHGQTNHYNLQHTNCTVFLMCSTVLFRALLWALYTNQHQILGYGVVADIRGHHCGHLIHRTVVCAMCWGCRQHLGTLLRSFKPPHAFMTPCSCFSTNIHIWSMFSLLLSSWIILHFARSCGHFSIPQMFTWSKHQGKAELKALLKSIQDWDRKGWSSWQQGKYFLQIILIHHTSGGSEINYKKSNNERSVWWKEGRQTKVSWWKEDPGVSLFTHCQLQPEAYFALLFVVRES